MTWIGPVLINALIFLAFFACCTLHHWLEHRKHPTAGESVHHAMVSGVFNPATVDAIKDFVAHLIVYSGYVIPPH